MYQGENLAFLISLPRSGSTLLSLILGSHPSVLCPPEPWFLLKLSAARARGSRDSPFDDELAALGTTEFLDPESFRLAAREFAGSVYGRKLDDAGKALFIDKTPRYFHIVSWLETLFPRARWIWLKRNPLDVALSYKKTWCVEIDALVGQRAGPNSLDFALGPFVLDAFFRERSPSKIQVRYEDLVRSPETTIERLCGFLGVSFDSKMLRFWENQVLLERHRAASMGDKNALSRREIRADRVGGWMSGLSGGEVRSLVELLGLEIFKTMGYGACLEKVRALGIDRVSEQAARDRRRRVRCAPIGEEKLERELIELRDLHGQSQRPLHERLLEGARRRVVGALGAPALSALRQHAPRPLHVPKRYASERPPRPAPTISIVTPSLNQGAYLRETIESVLDQAYPNLQYIVQDGGSSDESLELLKSFGSRIQSASVEDTGQANALNRGFARATGEILAWLNADDILLPGALNYVARFFVEHPEVEVVYGNRVVIDEDGQEVGRWVLPGHSDEVLSWADYVPQETLFWRRNIWKRAGAALDESFDFALDWDLLLRFREAGARMMRLPRFLAAFRIQPGQKTSLQLPHRGREEMDRIRRRIHGRYVPAREVARAVAGYVDRAALMLRLARLGLFQDWRPR